VTHSYTYNLGRKEELITSLYSQSQTVAKREGWVTRQWRVPIILDVLYFANMPREYVACELSYKERCPGILMNMMKTANALFAPRSIKMWNAKPNAAAIRQKDNVVSYRQNVSELW